MTAEFAQYSSFITKSWTCWCSPIVVSVLDTVFSTIHLCIFSLGDWMLVKEICVHSYSVFMNCCILLMHMLCDSSISYLYWPNLNKDFYCNSLSSFLFLYVCLAFVISLNCWMSTHYSSKYHRGETFKSVRKFNSELNVLKNVCLVLQNERGVYLGLHFNVLM